MRKYLISVVWLLTFFAVTYAAAGPDTCSRNNSLLAEIPFRLHGHMIIAEFSVDGSAPLSFIFDTAAGGTIISAKTASKLGIVGKESVSREGAMGASRIVRSKNHAVIAGNLRLRNVTLGIADLGHIDRRSGIPVDGVIGWTILSEYAVRVNYDAMQIEIYDAEKPYSGIGGKDYDIEVKGTVILTDVTVVLQSGESFSGKVMVDTGSGGTSASLLRLPQIRSLLSQAGKEIGISVDRKGELHSFQLKLRPLIE